MRCEEAREAATLLGADYLHFEVQYLSICYDNDSHRCVIAVVRKIPPDMVFTTPPVDYISDHEMTSRLVRDACFAASVPNYIALQPNPHHCQRSSQTCTT